MCFVAAGPQMGLQIVPVPFQTSQCVAVPVSVGQSQGLGQSGADCTGPWHPLTTATNTGLGLSTTAPGNRKGSSARSLCYRPGLGCFSLILFFFFVNKAPGSASNIPLILSDLIRIIFSKDWFALKESYSLKKALYT